MYWNLSYRSDPSGRRLADRHYNRQHVGHHNFVPPGRCLVLVGDGGVSVWVTSWPKAEYVLHRWAGAWVNSLFRREGGPLASTQILEAVAATRAVFGDPPPLGMVTFVDPSKVRHKRDPGRCYLRAGFEPDGQTKSGLVALRLVPQRMPAPEPAKGTNETLQMFPAG